MNGKTSIMRRLLAPIVAIFVVSIFMLSVPAQVTLSSQHPAGVGDSTSAAIASTLAGGKPLSASSFTTAQLNETLVQAIAAVPVPAAWAHPSHSAVPTAEGSVVSIQTYVESLLPSSVNLPSTDWMQVDALVSAELAGNARGINGAIAPIAAMPLVHPDSSSASFAIGGSTVGALAVFTFLVCAGTLGLGCVAAIAATAFFAICLFYNGQQAAVAFAEAAANQAKLLIQLLRFEFQDTATTIYDLEQQWNATYVFQSYKAAAAALIQLGNSTFNTLQDAIQGNISAELAQFWMGAVQPIIGSYVQFMNVFNVQEGSVNPSGFYCSMDDSAEAVNSVSSVTASFPSPSSATCAGSSPSSFDYNQGNVTATVAYGLTAAKTGAPAFYFNPDPLAACTNVSINIPSSPTGQNISGASGIPQCGFNPGVVIGDPAHAFTNVSVQNVVGGPVTVVSFPSSHQVLLVNFAHLKPGGYYMWTSVTGATAYVPYSVPMNAAAIPNQGFSILLYPNASSTGLTSATAFVLSGSPCIAGGAECAYAYGQGSPVGTASTTNLGLYLYQLENYATTVGQVYWLFLRNLGYTQANQVPLKCYIPPPNQVFPSSLTYTQLIRLNATSLYGLYYGALETLAFTFNSSASLTGFTICGKHASPPNGDVVTPFGTYAFGWLYDNQTNSSRSANGTLPQKFGHPNTWNFSGIFWLSPILSSTLTIALNQTWDLGEYNIVTGFYQPLENATKTAGGYIPITNGNGPSQCLVYNASGCNLTRSVSLFGFAVGNSTLQNGSTYPTHLDSSFGPGVAVYLTACFVPVVGTPTSNLQYTTHQTTCTFTSQSISVVGNSTQCSYTVNLKDCSGGGCVIDCGIVTGGCAGDGIWGIGPIIDAVNSFIAPIPFIGSAGCFFGYVFVFILVIIIVAIIFLVVRAVREG